MMRLAMFTWMVVVEVNTVVATPVSITFNETLVGFGTPGGSPDDSIPAFEEAYDVRAPTRTDQARAAQPLTATTDGYMASIT